MTLKSRPTYFLQERIVDQDGKLTPVAARAFQDIITRCDLILTNVGQIQSSAPVVGRTEGIGTTVSNLTSSGQLNNLTNVAAGRTTDNISDGTGSPLTGGKRGFQAINASIRIAGSTVQVPVSLNGAFTGANPLAQSGVTTTINVAAWSMQFGNIVAGDGVGGSVNPGVFGTFFVYVDMPVLVFALGGGLSYFSTSNVFDLTANDGRICLGKITTAGGGGGTGAGTGGGGNTGVRTLI
jgi:hypothetical protein